MSPKKRPGCPRRSFPDSLAVCMSELGIAHISSSDSSRNFCTICTRAGSGPRFSSSKSPPPASRGSLFCRELRPSTE